MVRVNAEIRDEIDYEKQWPAGYTCIDCAYVESESWISTGLDQTTLGAVAKAIARSTGVKMDNDGEK